jgi:hypothetical protein
MTHSMGVRKIHTRNMRNIQLVTLNQHALTITKIVNAKVCYIQKCVHTVIYVLTLYNCTLYRYPTHRFGEWLYVPLHHVRDDCNYALDYLVQLD